MSSKAYSFEYPPFPTCLPPEEGEPARQKLSRKSWLNRLLSSLRNQRYVPGVDEHREVDIPLNEDEPKTLDIQPIILVEPVSDEDDSQDRFAWAVLYENQRGITMFSAPHYSHRSLLPMDPAPFTLPSASLKRSKQPFMSLDDYQPPDGTWRWVSKMWMIDMRSDTGEVQYDGFEYNWLFRRHHWRAEIGPWSAGAWVRRRRWIRLMMRPGKGHIEHELGRMTPDASPGHQSSDDHLDLDADNTWRGRDSEDDWNRCHALMKKLDLDGHILELWYAWLEPSWTKGKGKEATTDNGEIVCLAEAITQVTSPPKKEYITPVLQRHFQDVLQLFIFPDSRAQWLDLVVRTGVLTVTNVDWALKEVDFWSYSEGLSDRLSHAKLEGLT